MDSFNPSVIVLGFGKDSPPPQVFVVNSGPFTVQDPTVGEVLFSESSLFGLLSVSAFSLLFVSSELSVSTYSTVSLVSVIVMAVSVVLSLQERNIKLKIGQDRSIMRVIRCEFTIGGISMNNIWCNRRIRCLVQMAIINMDNVE